MVQPLALKKPGLLDQGMAFDIRVQNVLEKKPWSDRPWRGHWG